MAAPEIETDPELDWLKRDKLLIEGLDHLGVEAISANLYSLLVPGISNLTERARYFALFPWALHHFAHRPEANRTQQAWREWIRRIEYTYATAAVALEMTDGSHDPQARATAVIGADTARAKLKKAGSGLHVDLEAPSALGKDGKPTRGTYFQNREGGYGQYYKGPLTALGVLAVDASHRFPDRTLTSSAGVPLAQALSASADFSEFAQMAEAGSATFSELLSLARRIGPGRLATDSEECSLLTDLFFGASTLSKGEPPVQTHARRCSFQLALHFIQACGGLRSRDFPRLFRRACLMGFLPDGTAWEVPDTLRPTLASWSAYERNEIFNYALETLLWAALHMIDEEVLTPRQVAARIADLACEAIPEAEPRPSLSHLDGTVSDWLEDCRTPEGTSAWEPGSTSDWADALWEAEEPLGNAPAWAARVLGRLVTDDGAFRQSPLWTYLSTSAELQLGTLLDRAEQDRVQPLRSFLESLLVEWVLFRHLRVATRKLSSQGVSTFKFRPEEGHLVLSAETIPRPTFTSPRLRQLHRILADLGCVEMHGDETSSITQRGQKFLEAP